jgi:hypothetical protein
VVVARAAVAVAVAARAAVAMVAARSVEVTEEAST